MSYTVRRVLPSEVRDGLNLAYRVFMATERIVCGDAGIKYFEEHIVYSQTYAARYTSGENYMFGAFDGDGKIIGMTAEQGGGYISLMFVDVNYRRKGIARALMNAMIEVMRDEYRYITLNASPTGIPFYLSCGFKATGEECEKSGFVVTPMKLDLYRETESE